ncbi:MAG: CapA family protein, partial [Spirochaetales bacterium]|nr:CapA family protein [Spirochaetales bacterium]
MTAMMFVAAGDYLAQLNVVRDDGFRSISDYVHSSDVRFVNLETSIFTDGDSGIYGNQFSGGTYLHADPSILKDLKDYGFNILSFANNHAFDFAVNGFLSTKKAVDEAGFTNAGAGIDLEEASAPAFIDTGKGKVALVAVNSSIGNPVMIAGRRSKRFIGRPGINPLREERRVQVTERQFATIKEIVSQSRVNAALDISRAEGYTAPAKEGEVTIGNTVFLSGPEAKTLSSPNKADMNRVLDSIADAKDRADFVLVSIHSHSVCGNSKEDIADFLVEFAHTCIDHGADAILGHGPHILRAVEIYRDRPVFYSLGDFILQCDDVQSAPADFYEKNGIEVDCPLEELFRKRSAGGTRGLKYTRKANESVIASFEIENGKLKDVSFLPIDMGFGNEARKGCPAPA